MNPPFNQRARADDLFLRALDEPESSRAEFLERECGSDIQLREEVRSLLAHYAAAEGSFLDQPAFTPELSPARSRPIRIGGYRVVRSIGSGGMGEVYEASQESPARQIAVKVLRPELAGPRSLACFRHEADILGRLQHPGIAHVYEAGDCDIQYESGLERRAPFLVMELIDGRPLMDAAARRPLELDGKLVLFAEICDAVHHAHQKGVIHRDLKPGNILIDAEGKPRILDFGVARLMDTGIDSLTRRTEAGQLIGTLAYMSPEQIAGNSDAIDSRSDIYSLGVILFELISGRLPLDIRSAAIAQAARIIQEEPPTRLGSLCPDCRGDIETIVGRAMEKEPDRRYASAAELAADIRRFLADEPILARPPTTIYQLKKLARRHRVAALGVAVGAIALIAGTTISIYAAFNAEKQRALAEKRLGEVRVARANAESTIDFLTQMLTSADPEALGREVRVTDVLKTAARDLESAYHDKPLTEARLRSAIGRTYAALGQDEAAAEHLNRALNLTREFEEPDSVASLIAMRELGVVQARRHVAPADSGLSLLKQSLDGLKQRLGENDPEVLESELEYGKALVENAKYAEAEPLIRDAWSRYHQVHGDLYGPTIVALHHLAWLLNAEGKVRDAEPLYLEAMTNYRRLFGDDNPHAIAATISYSESLGALGRGTEAEPYYREAFERSNRILGADHRSTLTAANNLASFEYSQARYEAAETLFRQTVETSRRVKGPDHPDTLNALANLAAVLNMQEKTDEAITIQRDIVERTRRALGDEHPKTGIAFHNLAQMNRRARELSQADANEREAIARFERSGGAEHPMTLSAKCQLGVILHDEGKDAESESELRSVIEARRRVLPADHPDTARSELALARVLMAVNRLEEAEQFFADGARILEKTLPDDHPDRIDADMYRGQCLVALHRFAEAEPILKNDLERATTRFGVDHLRTQTIRRALSQCHDDSNTDIAADSNESTRADSIP